MTTPANSVFLEQRLIFEDFLNSHELRVTFTKTDGKNRELRCTRNPELFRHLLPLKPVTEKPPVKASDKQVRVWDLDKNGWRSFNVDTVLDWAIVGGPDEEAPATINAPTN